MTRVYLDDLAAELPRWTRGNTLNVSDVYGATVTVHHRTTAAVNNFLHMGCVGLAQAGVRWNDLAPGTRWPPGSCRVRNQVLLQYSQSPGRASWTAP